MASLGDSEESIRKSAWEGPTLPSFVLWILERRVSYSPPQSMGSEEEEERRRMEEEEEEEEEEGVNSDVADCS